MGILDCAKTLPSNIKIKLKRLKVHHRYLTSVSRQVILTIATKDFISNVSSLGFETTIPRTNMTPGTILKILWCQQLKQNSGRQGKKADLINYQFNCILGKISNTHNVLF